MNLSDDYIEFRSDSVVLSGILFLPEGQVIYINGTEPFLPTPSVN